MPIRAYDGAVEFGLMFVNPIFLSCPYKPKFNFYPKTCSRHIASCSIPTSKRQPRKPTGFWDEIENIRKELFAFQKTSADVSEGTMPTARQLRAAGRRDLDNAISKHGGYHKLSEALGMKRASGMQAPGYWNDFANLEREIRAFLKAHHETIPDGSMPTQKQFRDLKRSDIVQGLEYHGGTAQVASKMGLVGRRSNKSANYWKEWANVDAEIRSFMENRDATSSSETMTNDDLSEKRRAELQKLPRMPSQRELRAAGRGDLAQAISKFHGGFRDAAKRLGFTPRKKKDFFYDSFPNLARELYSFASEVGEESVMPSTALIQARGRTDLAAAIRKYDGMSEVSQRLGLQYRVRAKEAFKDWDIFRRSLGAFIERHGTLGEIPSCRSLTNFGRSDLYQGILHHGGPRAVADRMELKRNFYQDFHNVGKELLDFIKTHGTEGVMPTENDFLEIGRSSLNLGVSKFGHSQVARRLGLREPLQSTQIALDTLLQRSLNLWEYCECDSDTDER